jgi:hypothetical protein
VLGPDAAAATEAALGLGSWHASASTAGRLLPAAPGRRRATARTQQRRRWWPAAALPPPTRGSERSAWPGLAWPASKRASAPLLSAPPARRTPHARPTHAPRTPAPHRTAPHRPRRISQPNKPAGRPRPRWPASSALLSSPGCGAHPSRRRAIRERPAAVPGKSDARARPRCYRPTPAPAAAARCPPAWRIRPRIRSATGLACASCTRPRPPLRPPWSVDALPRLRLRLRLRQPASPPPPRLSPSAAGTALARRRALPPSSARRPPRLRAPARGPSLSPSLSPTRVSRLPADGLRARAPRPRPHSFLWLFSGSGFLGFRLRQRPVRVVFPHPFCRASTSTIGPGTRR